LAIAWVLRQPGITAAIVGAKRAAQVQENVRAAALLDRELNWAEIDRIVGSYRG
jgi:aryl-alcohol dehydrogenase-like predicted oxidoreductase